MKKTIWLLAALCLVVNLAACGGGASSSNVASITPESQPDSIPDSSAIPEAEPEPVDPTEETLAQLQGLWGVEWEDELAAWFGYVVFEGETCYIYSCPWVATEPRTRKGIFAVEENTVTMNFEAIEDGKYGPIPAKVDVAELSPDSTTMTIITENEITSAIEKRQLPTDVDYFGGYEDWKYGQAEMGLRLRTAPNTDAEIICSIDRDEGGEPLNYIWVLGTSQVDPSWSFIMYGSQVGFASSEYIQIFE